MDLNLEDDDDMIVIVVGDDEQDNDNENSKNVTSQNCEENINMPFPVTIKVEPLEEDEVVSLNVENIIRTAAEYGELMEIKQEFSEDYLLSDFDEPKIKKKKKLKRKAKVGSKKKKVSKIKNTQPEEPKISGPRRKIVSRVEELRNSNPELKKNKLQLITHIANLMRLTVPPPPPRDYYRIDVDGTFICSFCEASTVTLAAAARHYQNRHGPAYLNCFACGTEFWCKTYLYKHEKRCSAPDAKIVLRARGEYLGRKGRGRPFLTNNRFIPRLKPIDFKTGLEKVITNEKRKFVCSFCPAEFAHKETWESHENIHNGIRPYACHICPYAYPSKMGLKKHLLKHGDQEFICDHCNKSFKLKVTLVSHMNTHLPERKYGCSMCSKRYAQKTALRVHVHRDHLNLPPPCACPQCPRRYPRMSHLKDHMLKEHGLKLMTRKMFYKNLPKMNLKEIQAAKVVFNSKAQEINDCVIEDAFYDATDYLEVPDDDFEESDVEEKNVKVVTEETPVFHIQYS